MSVTGENEKTLIGARVAVLISDGFEQSEFDAPVWELRKHGALVHVLAQSLDQVDDGIQGMSGLDRARLVRPDKLVRDADPSAYDGLLIPGGAISVDRMRTSALHLGFVRHFMNEGKPVAVICHGAWLLADSGMAQGRTLTTWPAIRKDLERAGAIWKDAEVLQDRNLITSRKPDDLPVFTRAFLGELAKSAKAKPRAA